MLDIRVGDILDIFFIDNTFYYNAKVISVLNEGQGLELRLGNGMVVMIDINCIYNFRLKSRYVYLG